MPQRSPAVGFPRWLVPAAVRTKLAQLGAAVPFAGRGAIESYELGKRIDAMAYTEWLEARDRPRAG
jgi:hypothetical protein